MKKMLKLLGIAALFAAVLGFFGCNNEDDSKDPEIKSIAVKTNPTKVTYTADEKFDPTGLVLTVKWTEGKADTEVKYADAKAKFTFAPALTAALTTTDKKVTVTYEKKTADIAITVNPAEVKPTTATVKGEYTLDGETFTISDGKVKDDKGEEIGTVAVAEDGKITITIPTENGDLVYTATAGNDGNIDTSTVKDAEGNAVEVTKPSTPTDPESPSDPADTPTPSDPNTPSDPSTPSDTTTPTDPTTPEDPTPTSKLPWTGTEVILNEETFTALKAELGEGVDGKSTDKNSGEYIASKAKATGIENLKALWASKESSKALETGKTYIGFYTASYDEENSKDVPAVAKVADDALLVYSKGIGNLRMRENGTINYNGDSDRYIAVDTSSLASSGKVKVTFTLKINTSSKTSDAKGKVFLSTSADDVPTDSKAFTVPDTALAKNEEVDLKNGGDDFDIVADNVNVGDKVYLFFSRNNYGGGGIDVTEIKVEAAE